MIVYCSAFESDLRIWIVVGILKLWEVLVSTLEDRDKNWKNDIYKKLSCVSALATFLKKMFLSL